MDLTERRREPVGHVQHALEGGEWFASRAVGQHRTTERHEPAAVTPQELPDAAPCQRDRRRDYAKDHRRQRFRRPYHDARLKTGSSITKQSNGFGVKEGHGATAEASRQYRRAARCGHRCTPLGSGQRTVRSHQDVHHSKIVSIVGLTVWPPNVTDAA